MIIELEALQDEIRRLKKAIATFQRKTAELEADNEALRSLLSELGMYSYPNEPGI